MGTEKVSLTLDGQLQPGRLTGYLADLEKEHGPIDTQVHEEVRRAWPVPEEKPRPRRNS